MPVIASEFVGSAYDLIMKGLNGDIYKTGNIDDLCEKISEAMKLNPENVRKSNDRILENWSYKSTWLEVESYIDK